MNALVSPPRVAPATRLSDEITLQYLEEYKLLPLAREAGRVRVAHAGAPDPQALAELGGLLGAELDLTPMAEDELLLAAREAYGAAESTAAELIAGLGDVAPVASEDDSLLAHDVAQLANQAPVIRLVNLLLAEAVDTQASDVHLEAERGALRVRYRVDGVLQDAPSPPQQLRSAVISRLKIMAELDIAERRLPQDGRVRLRVGARELDVRVSTLPTLHGENVVLRLLDNGGERIRLEGLGMASDTLDSVLRFARRPQGVLLATGPTGSGKTTTLYGALEHIRTGREKIVSVEDPVEYELPGVTQVPVHTRSGLTFARALRSILRQDPDVLLVGEMRDPETAEICTQAALTGHLVLSTLHTNDAPSALTRLIDLGVADYLIASTVEGVLAQRLVRRICRDCMEPATMNDTTRRELVADGCDVVDTWLGRGCATCRGTGYRGRTGIYEMLVVDEEVRAEFLRRPDSGAIRRVALAKGMRPLRADGWRQVAAGATTVEEVLRVTQS